MANKWPKLMAIINFTNPNGELDEVVTPDGSVGDGGVWWNEKDDDSGRSLYRFIPFHRLLMFKNEYVDQEGRVVPPPPLEKFDAEKIPF